MSNAPERADGRWWAVGPILVGLAAIVALGVTVRHTELLTGRYISGGVPPVSAFALLLALLTVGGLLRRLSPRLGLSRRQVLLPYLMMCLGSALLSPYLVRAWLPHLTVLRYWERQTPELEGLSQYLPRWMGPRIDENIVAYWEGTYRAGAVPWSDWFVPLAMWSVFLLALFVAVYSFMALFQRQWIRNERLTFPLLYLPLTLTAPDDGGPGSRLFRRHLFWYGIAVAMLFNGVNIAHVFVPSFPAPGFSKGFAEFFTAPPWTPLRSIRFYYMLETVGFGYFIPLEVTFTTWFAYFAIKFLAVGGVAMGYERPGFPFIHEQCAGAYVAVVLVVLWSSRRYLARLWAVSWRRGGSEDTEEGPGEPFAWIGLLLGSVVILQFMGYSGLPLVVAGSFWLVLLGFILVYARIRAETGAPLEFTYPYWMPKQLVTWGFGPSGILGYGGLRTPVVFGMYSWLSRHHFGMSMAAYEMDGFKLASTVGISRQVLLVAVAAAFVVGLATSTWAHLDAYYDVGTNLASGSLGSGEYRAKVSLEEFKRTAADLATLPPRPLDRLSFVFGGFGVALWMSLMRRIVLGFPLHPLGYILATAYGDHNTAIFPMFVAWAAKAAILRLGGLRMYRAGVPFFIGLIAGHFFWAGVFWPMLSLLVDPEQSRAYHLFFGG